MPMDVPRCVCGFVAPGPMHRLFCEQYEPGKVYPTPTVALPRDLVRRLIADLELLTEDAERLASRMYFTDKGGPFSTTLSAPATVLSEHARQLRDAEAAP